MRRERSALVVTVRRHRLCRFVTGQSGVKRNGITETYLSESLAWEALCGFLRLGVGIRHSIWKATQLVQGTPRLAASQRTCGRVNGKALSSDGWRDVYLSCMACLHRVGGLLADELGQDGGLGRDASADPPPNAKWG